LLRVRPEHRLYGALLHAAPAACGGTISSILLLLLLLLGQRVLLGLRLLLLRGHSRRPCLPAAIKAVCWRGQVAFHVVIDVVLVIGRHSEVEALLWRAGGAWAAAADVVVVVDGGGVVCLVGWWRRGVCEPDGGIECSHPQGVAHALCPLRRTVRAQPAHHVCLLDNRRPLLLRSHLAAGCRWQQQLLLQSSARGC
jgi:hypothetical protein